MPAEIQERVEPGPGMGVHGGLSLGHAQGESAYGTGQGGENDDTGTHGLFPPRGVD